MYSKLFFLLFVLSLCNFCKCARILAVMPTPSFSHQVVFQPLWKELLVRGHDVTLLTTDPMKDVNVTNLRQIDWHLAYNLLHVTHNLSEIIINFRQNKLQSFNQYAEMMHDIVSYELSHEDVQNLINNKNENFDLAIIEFLHPTMLAFSEIFKCPFIGVSSMDSTTFGHESVGNPTNPAVYTDFLVPYVPKMTFFERLLNTVNYIGVSLYFHYYVYPREDKTVKQYFGDNISRLQDIQKKVSVVFTNTHPVLHSPRPLMPNVIQIGGAIHLRNLTTLPEELEVFLNASENGVIYFSLGSNVKVKDLPQKTLNIILETFTHSEFRVVWKVEDLDLVKNLSNIYAAHWLPQQEILAHKKVKAFITQGGQQSLEEAIYYGVPVIGFPFYIDQFANIRRLSRKGACINLEIDDLKKEEFQFALHEIVTNQSYLNSIRELSVLLKEKPISSLHEAVWWTEYVIRHKGAAILKSDVPYMPFYQYYLLDVLAAFLFLLITILLIEYKVVKLVIKYIRSKVREDKFYKME